MTITIHNILWHYGKHQYCMASVSWPPQAECWKACSWMVPQMLFVLSVACFNSIPATLDAS